MVMLADKPDIREAVANDAAAAGAVVDELLRLACPAQGMFRVVRKPVTVAGTLIPQGATAILMYASGNRDAHHFDEPDELRLDRAERQHLAFGHGIHFCIGSHLSRMEAEVALTQLCRRIDRLWLNGEPEYKPSFVLSGPRLLNLGFTSQR
jgi:cytochrome P450